MQWWQTGVVYQIYPRSFADGNGDGVGDLPGITARVPYLAETLGVDAVWLSPFYPSPQADFGYDVADYCDVDPQYGTLADFDALVAACHDHGLRVIVDVVPNHSSDRHPWFVESRSAPESARRDWYVWRDPAPGGGPPNNWLSVFGGSAWAFDEATGQYYLHSFLAEQPDLNWRNPEVREAMADVFRFWMDRGVDGFRLDVAHRIGKDPDFRDDPPAVGATDQLGKDMAEYGSLIHEHSMGHADAHQYFAEIRAVLDGYDDRYAVGEIHEADWDRWASWHGEGRELHQVFDFSLLYAPWNAADIGALLDAQEAALGAWGWPNHVLGNHDEPRLATRRGQAAARVGAMLLLTTRGTPTLYYGDEIGMVDADIAPADQLDPWAHRAGVPGRDGCRTPMQWDASPHAGFTAGTTTWRPIHPGHEITNVEAELADPASMLSLYRHLLALRREEPALRAGDYRRVDVGPDVLAYERTDGERRFLVLLSFGTAASARLPGSGEVVASTDHRRHGERCSGSVSLGDHEGLVLRIP